MDYQLVGIGLLYIMSICVGLDANVVTSTDIEGLLWQGPGGHVEGAPVDIRLEPLRYVFHRFTPYTAFGAYIVTGTAASELDLTGFPSFALELVPGSSLRLRNLTLLLPPLPTLVSGIEHTSLLAHVFQLHPGSRLELEGVRVVAASCSDLYTFTVSLCNVASWVHTADVRVLMGTVTYVRGAMPMTNATDTRTAAATAADDRSAVPDAAMTASQLTCPVDEATGWPPTPWPCTATVVRSSDDFHRALRDHMGLTYHAVLLSLKTDVSFKDAPGDGWTYEVPAGCTLALLGDPANGGNTQIDFTGRYSVVAVQQASGGRLNRALLRDVTLVGLPYPANAFGFEMFLSAWVWSIRTERMLLFYGREGGVPFMGNTLDERVPMLLVERCRLVIPDQELIWWINAADGGVTTNYFRIRYAGSGPKENDTLLSSAGALCTSGAIDNSSQQPPPVLPMREMALPDFEPIRVFTNVTLVPLSAARRGSELSSSNSSSTQQPPGPTGGSFPMAVDLGMQAACKVYPASYLFDQDQVEQFFDDLSLAGHSTHYWGASAAGVAATFLPYDERLVYVGGGNKRGKPSSCSVTGPFQGGGPERVFWNHQGLDYRVIIDSNSTVEIRNLVLFNLPPPAASPRNSEDSNTSSNDTDGNNGSSSSSSLDGGGGVPVDASGNTSPAGGPAGRHRRLLQHPTTTGTVGSDNVFRKASTAAVQPRALSSVLPRLTRFDPYAPTSGGSPIDYAPPPWQVPEWALPMINLTMPLWYFDFDRTASQEILRLVNVTLVVPPVELQLLMRLLGRLDSLTGETLRENPIDQVSDGANGHIASPNTIAIGSGSSGGSNVPSTDNGVDSVGSSGGGFDVPFVGSSGSGSDSTSEGDASSTDGHRRGLLDATELDSGSNRPCLLAVLAGYLSDSEVGWYSDDSIFFHRIRHFGWSGTNVLVTTTQPSGPNAPEILDFNSYLDPALEAACPPTPPAAPPPPPPPPPPSTPASSSSSTATVPSTPPPPPVSTEDPTGRKGPLTSEKGPSSFADASGAPGGSRDDQQPPSSPPSSGARSSPWIVPVAVVVSVVGCGLLATAAVLFILGKRRESYDSSDSSSSPFTKTESAAGAAAATAGHSFGPGKGPRSRQQLASAPSAPAAAILIQNAAFDTSVNACGESFGMSLAQSQAHGPAGPAGHDCAGGIAAAAAGQASFPGSGDIKSNSGGFGEGAQRSLLTTNEIEGAMLGFLASSAALADVAPSCAAACTAASPSAAPTPRQSGPQTASSIMVRDKRPRGGLVNAISRVQEQLRGTEEDEVVQLDCMLGHGSQGVVYAGTWHGLRVAVKIMVVHDVGGDTRRRQSAILEAAISTSLDHPNIVRSYTYDLKQLAVQPGAGADQEGAGRGAGAGAGIRCEEVGEAAADTYQLYIVQELCEGGSLKGALRVRLLQNAAGGGAVLQAVAALALDVACGMHHLHTNNIVHGDVSSGNVLLARRQRPDLEQPFAAQVQQQQQTVAGVLPCLGGDAEDGGQQQPACEKARKAVAGCWQPPLMAKITDFGLSVRMAEGQTHTSNKFQGTPIYMAPEVLASGRVSKASDVFSFGVLLLELACGMDVLALIETPRFRAAAQTAAASATHAATPAPVGTSLGAGDGGELWQVQSAASALLPAACPDQLRQLVTRCLAPAPAERPGFEQVLSGLVEVTIELSQQSRRPADRRAGA